MKKITLSVLLVSLLLPSAGVFAKKTATAAKAKVATSVDQITYPELPAAQIPQPERVELGNGMVVMLIEDHEMPLVEARVIIRTGARLESAEKTGLAGLTGSVLRTGGSESMTGDELDDYLEDHAAVLETSIGSTSGSAFMSSLTGDYQEMLGVFADVLRNPVFDEEKLQVAKNQVESGIARQNDNASQVLGREFQELIYGEDSPYARNETYDSLASITRDDLVAWHERYFHPNRMIFGLVGDFDRDEALATLEKTFGDWKAGPKMADPTVPPPKTAAPGIYHVAKEDVTQSFVRLGHLGVQRDHPDYYALEVMNEVFGGGFAARLFSRVRSRDGLAYAVYGGVYSQWDYPGAMMMHISTKTETTAAGIDALLREAKNLTSEPPTAEEVAKAKEAILASFVFRATSTSQILNQQLNYEYYGFPLDWQERYRRGIESVTVEQVREAATKHLRPDEFVILAVGKSEGLDRPLSSFGEVNSIDISIPEPAEPEVEISEESLAQGEALMARYIDYITAGSGAESMPTVYQAKAAAEVVTPQGAMTIQVASTIAHPDRLHQEMTLPFGKMSQVVDGASGFIVGPQGTQPMPDSALKSLHEQLLRSPAGLVFASQHDDFRAAVLGQIEHEGKELEKLRVEAGGTSFTLGIDPESGSLVMLTYRGQNMMGAPGEIVTTFADYREVDGVRLPYQAISTFNGEPMSTMTVESMNVGVEVDESLFQQPE